MPQEEVVGNSYLYCLPNTAESEEYPAVKHICAVSIRISPELMPTFRDRIHELPTEFRKAIFEAGRNYAVNDDG